MVVFLYAKGKLNHETRNIVMGRKRLPVGEKKVTLIVPLKEKVVIEMEKHGDPRKIAENILTQKFTKE